MSQGRVDVEGLLGDGALARHRHHRDGPHVVKSVGQFDQEHAPVLGHGDEHLANRGGLLGLFGVEFESVQFGNPVDHGRYLGPELLREPLRRDPGVFYGVVEQGGRNRDLVKAKIGRNPGHRDRVGHVRLARTAQLTLVGVNGSDSRPTDQLHVAVGVVLAKTRNETLNRAQ